MQAARSVDKLQPSYIREILSAATSPGVISLAGGLPAEESFPMELIAPAIDGLKHDPGLCQYGPTRGYEPLVEFLRSSLEPDSARDLLVCNGSQQALDLVARTFLDPGDVVVMEAPSYLGALQVFQLAQATILTVEQTPRGPDPVALDQLFRRRAPKIFYGVPDFHNPTGVCWSRPVRLAVADLCRRHGVTLVEDSPYRELRFAGETLQPMVELLPENTIQLASFSKTVAPGLRLGIATGPGRWIDLMVRVKQAADLHTAVPPQAILGSVLCHKEFDNHLQRVRRLYGQRYQVLSDAIRRHMRGKAFHEPVNGGMFIWLHLAGVDTYALAKRALKSGVAVVPGGVFYPGHDVPGSYLRLNFSHATGHRLNDAVGRLASCVNRC